MRIFLISGNYPPTPCGIGDHTHRLARELAQRGYRVSIYTSQTGTAAVRDTVDEKGLEVFPLASTWDHSEIRRILELAHRYPPQLIHIQYHPASFRWQPTMNLLPRLIKRFLRPTGPKVVVTLHELAGPRFFFFPPLIRRLWLLPLLASSDAIIVTNRRDLKFLGRVPFLTKKLHLIPLASNVDFTPFAPADRQALRRRLGIREGEWLLVRFGFVHNLKTSFIPELLKSQRMLLDQGYPLKLLLLGDISKENQVCIELLCRRLGVLDRVLLTGYLPPPQVSAYLQASELAIQLYPEGVSEKRTALHAVMNHGIPVIALGRSTDPFPFLHQENVLLIPSPRPNHIAEAVVQLITEPNLRQRIARNAPKVLADSRWDRIGQQTDALYRSLLTEDSP